jgi:hypothetical protein
LVGSLDVDGVPEDEALARDGVDAQSGIEVRRDLAFGLLDPLVLLLCDRAGLGLVDDERVLAQRDAAA